MAFRQRHDPTKSLVGFVVGDVVYAVSIFAVREICQPLPLVLLPKAPSSVLGVTDYRGEVIPVVDLRLRFGLPASAEPSRREKWIVIDVAHGAFDVRGPGRNPPPIRGPAIALSVDRVTEVFGTQGVELRAAPDLGGGEAARAIAGVTQKGAQLVFVLDPRSFRAISDSVSPPPMFAHRSEDS